MSEHFDAIIIGAGIAGETCARRLNAAGMRVAVVERDHVGGECAYWGRIPSKTLFGPANEVWRAQQIAGVHSPSLGRAPEMVSTKHPLSTRDDQVEAEALGQSGITLLRGDARILGGGRVQISERLVHSPHIVIAAGAAPRVPEIPGLAEAEYWTNREALRYQAIPQHVLLLGGEAQTIELAQMFRLYGSQVTLIAQGRRLMSNEDPEIGEQIAGHLQHMGVRVVLGQDVVRVARDGEGEYVATLSNDENLPAQSVVVAGRRAARTEWLNGAIPGLEVTDRGVHIDEYCRAAEGIWAIGDVTGTLLLSHLAQYQAHLAADDILRYPHPANYLSVPRLYFTEPQIAATGLTLAEAAARHIEISSVTVDLRWMDSTTSSIAPVAPPHLVPDSYSGKLSLSIDTSERVLVGSWVVAPDAAEWIHLAVLAIGARVPLAALYDTLEQFPGFSEPYRVALEQLNRRLPRSASGW
jgi:pyruvate/2-oxoglutarate dehydrogenase complex dihydrolipoamide dehydrogenase (E3) component